MRTVCLGDSITRGYGVGPRESWISLLNTQEQIFINKGVNGDTTGGMLARFYSDAVIERPNYVLLEGGLNDFMAGASEMLPQSNYYAMVHQAFHYNMIPVVCTCLPFDPSAARAGWSQLTDFDLVKERYEALRHWLFQLCHAYDLFCLDFYGEFEKVLSQNPGKNFFIDGIHPTAQGHSIMADIAGTFFRNFKTQVPL